MTKNMGLLSTSLFVLLGLMECLVPSGARASTVVVGTCKSGLTQFSTIQEAVNGVPAGSTVDICPGTYSEQVKITEKLRRTRSTKLVPEF